MPLVMARVETIGPGDLLRLPNSGRLVPFTHADETLDGELVLHWRYSDRDQGTFAPLRRGERWPVERAAASPAITSAPAGPPSPAPPLTAPAISDARARALAMVLAGFRWPGFDSFSALNARRRTAAEQVARSALEHLGVVE